jgi:hypothetical protein
MFGAFIRVFENDAGLRFRIVATDDGLFWEQVRAAFDAGFFGWVSHTAEPTEELNRKTRLTRYNTHWRSKATPARLACCCQAVGAPT